ncbi:sugar phosphate isomerase/epimerase [Roseimicrobium gellanilyticum]|uniref:Sugar phosphate isomerase/epimerase n=1 Tax=Roseimicrobium gellanilyticum TaxID=748857 RepID=A0A366HI77_9BACT|nr:sugar phosphate isomerase/epimerase family protein [Roseimicrobium gellanilyticum]RBP42362.1 sugar phosphate isomerase/epimerase [Roseimicrobium gellanilyticum]
MNRRHFLSSAAAALGASALPAIEPINRKGKSRMMLGLAAYSFRDNMKWMKGKENTKLKAGGPAWDILDFIDYCADQGCPGAELTSYFFPPDCDEKYLLEVKRRAYLRGVNITGTAVGNTFTHPKGEARDKEIAYVKEWIEKSTIMGAPHIRVFAGTVQKGSTPEEAEKNCQECYDECLAFADKKGVFLGLENHGGIVAEPEPLIKMVRAAKSPWAGINFDSGNFHTEDPYGDMAKIAPYAVNVQLKMKVKPKDSKEGEPVDTARVLKILKDANYQGWFTLEYEEKEDPFVAVPRILADLKPQLA